MSLYTFDAKKWSTICFWEETIYYYLLFHFLSSANISGLNILNLYTKPENISNQTMPNGKKEEKKKERKERVAVF